MVKRLKFQCWHCPKTYYQNLDASDGTNFNVFRRDALVIIVSCPYCGAEAIVDLQPYLNKTKTVLRGENNGRQTEEIQLPEILPTRKPE